MSIITLPTSTSASTQAVASRTALQSELARYQKERSACVNCASASTLQGEQNIQQIDVAISSMQARLNSVTGARSADSANESNSATVRLQTSIDLYA